MAYKVLVKSYLGDCMKNNTDDAYDMVINKTCIYYYLMSYTAHYRAYIGWDRVVLQRNLERVV